MDLGLSDGTWIVTGGTSGLGLAAATAISAEGGHVIVVGRDADRATAAAASLPGVGHAVAGDLADPALGDQIISVAAAAPHPLRGALVSVGGPPAGLPTQVSDDDWRTSFESVLLGPVRLTRHLVAAFPQFESIAWVLSTSAKSPITGLTISNGLRPGLAMLVKDFADELGPRGIRVNGLLPGRFDTPRVRALESGAADAAALRDQLTAAIPLGRYGDPAEFGAIAAFVLSPAAGYLTGSVIAVDGGSSRAL
jgi:3-oxoacyl-[acyl-carrier protein] reductase